MTPLKTQAIQKALRGDWQAAINLNEQILSSDPSDIDTLNRLGFAYVSTGNIKEGKNYYQKVLLLDEQNPIALKNLKRLSSMNHTPLPQSGYIMNNIFIEEPGKTKVVELLNLADQKALSHLRCGEELQLSIKRMKIFVSDTQKQYLGILPDDISKRLIEFIQGGNEYSAFIKTVNSHKVTVFIKETARSARLKNQQSFASTEKTKFPSFEKRALEKNDIQSEE